MKKEFSQLLQQFPAIESDKPLAPLTTFHVGGSADFYYKLVDLKELPPIIDMAQKLNINFFVLGGGSNTIFADKGFRGLIIHLQAKKITLENDEKSAQELICAEAGALLSQVIQFALQHKFSGMEKLMGLPGTIGGAVTGNAGAFGMEMKDIFAKASLYDPQKGVHEVGPEYLDFHYRSSTIKKTQQTVLKVYLKLKKDDPVLARQAMAEAMDILKNRISKQPKGYCSGSFFKNPVPGMEKPDDPQMKAGYLLEQAGCKGLQKGQIKVSEQHANWLMNLGGGTQKDLLELAKILHGKVKDRFNISLEPEVQFVSETGSLKIDLNRI